MKKIGIITLICSVALLLCACTNNVTGAEVDDNIQNELTASENTDEIPTSYKASWQGEIQVFGTEDVKVTPGIVEYDFESACEKGEKQQIYGTLPGASEGIWYIVTVDGVEYYYGRYDFSVDRTELFGYAIVSGEHSLANGISVGMTKNEVIELYPAMAMLDMENNSLNGVVGHMGWNSTAYPCSPVGMDEKLQYADGKEYRWDDQFDYVMIADVEQQPEALPVYVALMMKDDIVSAITFYYPTAG